MQQVTAFSRSQTVPTVVATLPNHLPGMIRACGDSALFERFRRRLIFAAIFLALVCISSYWWDLKGIVLVVARL